MREKRGRGSKVRRYECVGEEEGGGVKGELIGRQRLVLRVDKARRGREEKKMV